jgi:hypothetical protein
VKPITQEIRRQLTLLGTHHCWMSFVNIQKLVTNVFKRLNPTLLADYVAALLKNHKSRKELQTLCVDQLYDFLGEGQFMVLS